MFNLLHELVKNNEHHTRYWALRT